MIDIRPMRTNENLVLRLFATPTDELASVTFSGIQSERKKP